MSWIRSGLVIPFTLILLSSLCLALADPKPEDKIQDKEMIPIPGGTFTMGCLPDDPFCDTDEKPERPVTVKPFLLDKHEVTLGQYRKCLDAGHCYQFSDSDDLTTCNWKRTDREEHPMNCATWGQANSYCQWRGKRLPTEAEWEYAARGPKGQLYPWGMSAPDCSRAVMDGGKGRCGKTGTRPVMSKPDGISPFGVFDLAGNVWEWCQDEYFLVPGGQTPKEKIGDDDRCKRVLRGGGHSSLASDLRSTNRVGMKDDGYSDSIGFRCAKDGPNYP